jgi:hypothetical protein
MTTKNPPLLRRLARARSWASSRSCRPATSSPRRRTTRRATSCSRIPPAAVQGPAAGAVRIGLKSVRLESYLKRKEMVVRTGDNEVEFRDYRRWAEPLDAAIGARAAPGLLGAPEVGPGLRRAVPRDQERDYDVSIDVRRCEGSQDPPGKYSASFSATIEISTTGAEPARRGAEALRRPRPAWDGRDFGQLASLLSADVGGARPGDRRGHPGEELKPTRARRRSARAPSRRSRGC